MRNLEIVAIFNQIADLLEIQGANPFRVRAYRRGAIAIQGLSEAIESMAQQGTLRDITGSVKTSPTKSMSTPNREDGVS